MGDTILLCSDGLTNCVKRSQLKAILSSDRSTAEICQQLIDAANHGGGSDNITVVLGRFVEHDEAQRKLDAAELPLDTSLADTVEFEGAEASKQLSP